MIYFKDLKNGTNISKTYKELVSEYLRSPVSEEDNGFLINMMIFLNHLNRKMGLKFSRITKSDWNALSELAHEMQPGLVYSELQKHNAA
jgi:hypothetical protein